MAELYYLSFRDIASGSTGVTSGEIYRLDDAEDFDWRTATLGGGQWIPWDQVGDVFRDKHVCFYIHGFNVNVDHGIKGGGPAAQQYAGQGGLGLRFTAADIVVPVLWPGDGFIAWSWFTAYGHARTAGARFSEFLMSRAFQARAVSFVSHSLGARVVLETVVQTPKPRFDFDTAILAAAAVDDNAFDDPEYAAAVTALRRIVILSSTEDMILKIFFTLGSEAERALWSDYKGDSRALGRYGPAFLPDSPGRANTEWYDIRPSVGQDHGDYFPAGWNDPPPTSGWTDKSVQVGRFCRDTFDGRVYPPDLPDWATDNTARFRPGWTPRF